MTNTNDRDLELRLMDAKNMRAKIRREFRRLRDTYGYEVFEENIMTDPRQAKYLTLLKAKADIDMDIRALRWGTTHTR